MAEFYLGQIIQGGWTFAPAQTLICDGSLLPITQNTALFSLLGNNFGGNGSSNFGIPDLRGRAMVGTGPMAGGSNYTLGQMGGAESVTLTTNNLPAHTHSATFNASGSTFNASSSKASSQVPAAGSVLGRTVDGANPPAALPEIYCPANTNTDVAMAGLNVAGTVAVGVAGNGASFAIASPYTGITTVIVTAGIYPSRP